MSAMLTPADLTRHHGTIDKTQHPVNRLCLATDGVIDLCERGKAYWLWDAVASYQSALIRGDHGEGLQWMQFWTLTIDRDANSAVLTCREDSDIPPAITQRIEYTDIAQHYTGDEIKLYVQWDGEHMTVMLPSEY